LPPFNYNDEHSVISTLDGQHPSSIQQQQQQQQQQLQLQPATTITLS